MVLVAPDDGMVQIIIDMHIIVLSASEALDTLLHQKLCSTFDLLATILCPLGQLISLQPVLNLSVETLPTNQRRIF